MNAYEPLVFFITVSTPQPPKTQVFLARPLPSVNLVLFLLRHPVHTSIQSHVLAHFCECINNYTVLKKEIGQGKKKTSLEGLKHTR